MNSKDYVTYWLKSAYHDLLAAESLFKEERYDWCLFLGHLVLEKTLKGLWVQDNPNKTPPKTHNLLKLAEGTKLQLTKKTKLDLLNINDFNIEVRYPDYKMKFYRRCNKNFTIKYFNIIKELYQWLKKKI